jgi:hypothetical protein
MTLPPCYSWSPIGKPVSVAYEAPQGRRVNVIGAYFSHGTQAGRFVYEAYASLPKSQAKKRRKSPQQIAADHGLWSAAEAEAVGPIDSGRLVRFLWRLAGRPPVHLSNWRRERPLVVVLDNYSVHSSKAVKEALPELEAANVFLFYLSSYSPELSAIEPIWNSVKHHQMQVRSYTVVGDLLRAVEAALARKARGLWAQEQPAQEPITTKQLCTAA